MSQLSITWDTIDALSTDERTVWTALCAYRGRENAVKKRRLARAVGMHERKLRAILKSLTQVHRLPIGSTPAHPPGYYIISNADEAREVTERYHAQALSLLYREMSIRRITAAALSRQIEMELTR